MRRLRRLRRHGRRRGPRVPPGLLPLQARRLEARVPPQHEQQHLGPRLQRGGAALRLDGQRQPERLPADPQPLLRDGPRLVGRACCGSIADSNRFYPITDKVRQVDWHGGFTAAAGHALYTARDLPAGVLEPHRVRHRADRPPRRRRSCSSRKGSDFALAQRAGTCWPATTSGPSPIMAEVGPDGNVWVIDWYNFIVQHNPTPAGLQDRQGQRLRDALRDKTHGRIYRIVDTDAKPAAPLALDPSDAGAAGRGAEERQPVLAAARPAAAGRARQEGRGAGADRAGRRTDRSTRSA